MAVWGGHVCWFSGHNFGPDLNISTIKWIVITFCTDTHDLQVKNPNKFDNLFFYLASSLNITTSTKMVNVENIIPA